ncbi:hypothetical protein L210DRAFT_3651280 [Boletus edulis BED1]|uniref:Uncharacterized protein n=1 Tax=Boletus edulis BED1 TaxID=1328754 RepID=A0AAD4BIR5_BOLED|nr:hypothetical protein L210DRAFT_3651280 [Boletus edulis BED1]
MPTRPSDLLSFDHEDTQYTPSQETLKLYASRCPTTQLPDRYRVTVANPNPPLVHFAFPAAISKLYKYAYKHNLLKFFANFPKMISPVSAFAATRHLSDEVQYELEIAWPFGQTADCGVILVLYNNYTMEEKMLINEDQEDVIEMVQEELGYDKSVRPKWYFDFHDEWRPGDEAE